MRAQSPAPMALSPLGGVSASVFVCVCVAHLCAGGGGGPPIPVRGHLQAEGHLEVCQLLPAFEDLGNLALQACLLLLQGLHRQLQVKPEAASEGARPLVSLPQRTFPPLPPAPLPREDRGPSAPPPHPFPERKTGAPRPLSRPQAPGSSSKDVE